MAGEGDGRGLGRAEQKKKMTLYHTTVELPWLVHLYNHENMFETGVVRANECCSLCQVRRHNRDIFSIFSNMKVCCVFSLKSPHRGDSDEYTQHTTFNIKTDNRPKLSQICSYGIFSKGLKNEFETAVGWLVGCFGFNGPLRQYFSLYRAISQREGEEKRIDR